MRGAQFDLRALDLDRVRVRALADAARAEGFAHVDRLLDGWASRANRFGGAGERLLGLFDRTELIGVGGLNRDPYLDDPQIGRIRHVYILPDRRRRGAGKELVGALVEGGAGAFRIIRVRAAKGDAPRFYEAIGFSRIAAADASHAIAPG